MRKALFLMAVLVIALAGVANAASKVATMGAPNSDGTYQVEVFDDRTVVIASDTTLSSAAIVATSAEIDGTITTDGTIYTAKITSDGAIYAPVATIDPCPTLGRGYIFFNTTGQPCYCNADGADVLVYSASTACM